MSSPPPPSRRMTDHQSTGPEREAGDILDALVRIVRTNARRELRAKATELIQEHRIPGVPENIVATVIARIPTLKLPLLPRKVITKGEPKTPVWCWPRKKIQFTPLATIKIWLIISTTRGAFEILKAHLSSDRKRMAKILEHGGFDGVLIECEKGGLHSLALEPVIYDDLNFREDDES